MMRLFCAWVFAAALLSGCGARSGLSLPGEAPPDAGLPDAAPLVPPPPDNSCPSAVSGSAPMRGYCSTRAHLAPHAAPAHPAAGWEIALPTEDSPRAMVVDDRGTVYAAVVQNEQAELVAVDDSGKIVGQHNFGGDPIRELFLARDGTARAMVGVVPPTLVRFDASGDTETLAELPAHTFRLAVGSDGSLFATRVDFSTPERVMHIDKDGALLWTSPGLDDGKCGGCISDVALTGDDSVIVATFATDKGTTLRRLDAHGGVAWRRHFEGLLTEGPAVAADGSIRLVTGVGDMATAPTTVVSAVSSAGDTLWQTRLDEDYQQTWDQALIIGKDGATFVHTFVALTALEPDGSVRWRIDAPSNLTYDAVVDADGTFVALLGAVRGLDAATGQERWHFDGPGFSGNKYFYLSNLALAPHGCLVGANYGGRLFSACDP